MNLFRLRLTLHRMRTARLLAAMAAAVCLGSAAIPANAIGAGGRIPWAGGQWFLLGANYPWYSYGADFGSNAWGRRGVHATSAQVDADFGRMAAMGIHSTRWWVFADGRAGIQFDTAGMPTGLDTDVFPDLDAAMAIAAHHRVYLDLVLLDFSWMSKPQVVNGVQLGGHANVINTVAGQQALLSRVFLPVFQRYGHNPQVISWEVMNEPEWAIADDNAVNGNISQPSSLANFLSFTRLVVGAVHANTASYVTMGEAAMKWDQQWVGQGLDFYQIHFYDWMHPYSNTNLFGALYSSLGLDRPVVVGEFPAANSSTANLQQYLDTWFNNGYAGAWSWSFRGIDGAGSPNSSVMLAWSQSHQSLVNIGAGPAPTATPAPTVRPSPRPTPTSTPHPTPTQGPAATATVVPSPTSGSGALSHRSQQMTALAPSATPSTRASIPSSSARPDGGLGLLSVTVATVMAAGIVGFLVMRLR